MNTNDTSYNFKMTFFILFVSFVGTVGVITFFEVRIDGDDHTGLREVGGRRRPGVQRHLYGSGNGISGGSLTRFTAFGVTPCHKKPPLFGVCLMVPNLRMSWIFGMFTCSPYRIHVKHIKILRHCIPTNKSIKGALNQPVGTFLF